MSQQLGRRCYLAFFFLFATLGVSQAQGITPQQKAICQRHDESDWCGALVVEFYTAHGLLAASPHTPLDQPWSDGVAFRNKIAPRAIRSQLLSDLKNKAEQKAHQAEQSALQTISIAAAITQVGSAPSSSGSTNLVTKPTTTDFLSMAAESGSFTDTLNGNALTLQANALGLTKYFSNQAVFERWDSRFADHIQPLNFTVTLNVAQSGSSATVTTGSANTATPATIASVVLPSNNASFGSFGASYNFYRPYNPQSKTFLDNWTKAVAANQSTLKTSSMAVATAVDNLLSKGAMQDVMENVTAAQAKWHSDGAAAEKSDNFDGFVSAFAAYDKAFCDSFMARPDVPQQVLDYSKALDGFNQAVYTVLNQARGKPLATVSYVYSTPALKPPTHDFTIALGQLFRGGKQKKDDAGNDLGENDANRSFMSGAQLTGNFTASIYSQLPAGAKYGRFRDIQFSAEFDKPFGGTAAEPRATWSVAGYGQYQYDPTVLNITQGNLAPGTNITLPSNAQVLLGTSGWIGVVQGKVTVTLSKGLTIPVALKWSNKTDLLKGNDVRGQFGLDYDLSALSKLISLK